MGHGTWGTPLSRRIGAPPRRRVPSPGGLDPVECDREQCRVAGEIRVGGEDRHRVAFGHSADQEVRIRALDAGGPADVEVLGRAFIVDALDRFIGERSAGKTSCR